MTASLHAQTMSSCCVNLSFFITCWWLQGWNELRPHEEMLVIVYCQVPLPPPVDLRWNSCFPGCLGNTKEKWLGFVTCSSSELLCRLHIRSWSFFFFYCYYLYLFINIFFFVSARLICIEGPDHKNEKDALKQAFPNLFPCFLVSMEIAWQMATSFCVAVWLEERESND